jgi:putative thioredoxin
MSQYAVDVTTGTFEHEVLEASKEIPVVVDFWAPWCGPCRALAPILEKLAAEYAGRFKLAKVNSDENQELAGTFGVRSIPDVMAFKNGQPVAHFLGVQPESGVRAFIEQLLPTPSDIERARAAELRESGRPAEAADALRQALALDDANQPARLDLAAVLIELAQLDDAEALLASVPEHIDWEERVATLRAALSFARSAASGAGEAELKSQIADDPANHVARLALARLYAGVKRYREALDELLEIVRRDKAWRDGEARKEILAIFNLVADEPELVSEYRRKLASLLY